MYRRILCSSIVALLAISSSGCEDVTGDRGIKVNSTGVVVGVAYVDRNGNGVLDVQSDGPVGNIGFTLIPRGGGTALTTTSNATGAFRIANVPVGEYELKIDQSSLPDSLRFIKIDPTNMLQVLARDSVGVAVTLSFPILSVKGVRAATPGKRVFVEGVTLNAIATFGDSTLHVADSTGVIRATRVVTTGVTTNTKVRLLGTTGVLNGLPTLTDVTVFNLGAGVQPAPTSVSTSLAASADGGKLDGGLVQVSNALIVGAQTNAALDVVLSVNDGTGLLDVVFDRQAGIATTNFVPGATLTTVGLLVPSGVPGVFQLKPRTASDASANFTTVTVTEARNLPAGRAVTIEGIALNSWFVFADSTVHINDATGSLRATRVAPINLFAGDRVRLLGVLTLQNGQAVLTNVSATVLGAGVLPLPEVITTARAATAAAGRLDAAFVKVLAGTITAVTTVANDVFLTVNDSTGPVEVMLDKDVGFATAPYVVNTVIDVSGLLVTKPGGVEWRLKPRQPADVVVRTP